MGISYAAIKFVGIFKINCRALLSLRITTFLQLEGADLVFGNAIQTLLHEFQFVFSKSTSLPPFRAHSYAIPLLPNSKTPNIRPYRYSHGQKIEIKNHVATLLEPGFIRPSSSPFASPVLLVKKKDNSWRFCVDYHSLNKIIVPEKYPIPYIDELLDELHGATIFSKIDLHSGCHQIDV
uniref:Reverse transcriptase domain-containing protein n=1 Tax=Solanum lycopersicum TaxID=4081 RepID=A0A3Q7HLM0_SOLLC